MAYELIFTSAEKGVNPSTSGFCTVAYTSGLMPSTIKKLEALSTYKVPDRARFNNANASAPPVLFSHYRVLFGRENFHLVSRIATAGQDYTNRQNKIAHHLLIRPREVPLRGPAWLAAQDGIFIEQWQDEPQVFQEERELPLLEDDNENRNGTAEESVEAETWNKVTGDAGWAGMVAKMLVTDTQKPFYLVFEPGMDMLKLVVEVLRLLPASRRWQMTFNTYFTSLPQGTECLLRCCLPDNQVVRRDAARNKSRVLNLSSTAGEPDPDDRYVKMARGNLDAQQESGTEELHPATAKRDAGGEKKGRERERERDFVLMENRLKKKIRLKPDNSS